jgi:hypothetical protein
MRDFKHPLLEVREIASARLSWSPRIRVMGRLTAICFAWPAQFDPVHLSSRPGAKPRNLLPLRGGG